MPPPAVITRGLSKRYGSIDALSDLDLEVREGEVLAYLGPNGAGKTTTIRLLLGLARPSAGSASIFGLDCFGDTVAVHRQLAYVPGETSLWPTLTGGETLDLLTNLHGGADAAYRAELVEQFDLDPSRKVRAYSRGNRQKVMLIAALMTRPRLLMLDEPTTGLDPLMEQAFRSCILEARSNGQTVFLSSHILSEVEAVCDRVAILRAGRLVEIGALADMRHLAAVYVEATFDGQPPDVAAIEGVTMVKVTGQVLTCQVHGPVAPLLGALAAAGVKKVLSREPSLEELFLAHYGTKDSDEPAQSPA